ncbi:MAG: hypothetical protein ACYDDF_04015 [Thermoplasmatota archaeon]
MTADRLGDFVSAQKSSTRDPHDPLSLIPFALNRKEPLNYALCLPAGRPPWYASARLYGLI